MLTAVKFPLLTIPHISLHTEVEAPPHLLGLGATHFLSKPKQKKLRFSSIYTRISKIPISPSV